MPRTTRLKHPKARQKSWSFLEAFMHLYERIRKYEKPAESGVAPAEGDLSALYQRISKMKAG